jgi:uncharacterized protein (DUF4213/DUF364 family)
VSYHIAESPAPRTLGDAALPHEIYRRLLAPIPLGLPVTSCVAGLVWTLVQAGGHTGLALTLQDGVFDSQLPGLINGVEARWLAERIAGWNMFEASLATAAINSWYNRRDVIEAATGRSLDVRRGARVFERLSRRFEGRPVAVVGHFPCLEPLRERCRLTILERRPSAGDLPDQACEYLLGQQDLVCITGSAVTNRTLPRLLELSRDAYVAVIGPSVPVTPLWFEYGVDMVAGTFVLSHDEAVIAVQQGAKRSVFGHSLATVEIEAEDWDASCVPASHALT